jgi:hypothetical protein
MNRLSISSLFIVLLECAGSPLLAQQRMDCSSWATTLTSGVLARADSQQRAYAGIQACPATIRGQAISRALERRKIVTSYHDLTAEAFAFATRDPAVFDMLVRMSHDPTATPTARVLAIAALLAMVDTHPGMQLDYFVRHREGEACIAGGSPVRPPAAGGPLAPDSIHRVYATLLPLERSRSTDPEVRSAANCALNVLRQHHIGQVAEIAPFEASNLTVRYKCGSSFVVTNRAPFSYLAAVRVPGTARLKALVVRGTRGHSSSQDTMFEGGDASSVDLVVDDVTYTTPNWHRACGRR